MHGDGNRTPRWLVPAWLHGALLAAWSVGIAWLYDEAAASGFGYFEPGALRSYAGPRLLLEREAEGSGFAPLASPSLLFAAAVVAGLLLGALFGRIGRFLDPARHSRAALWRPLWRVHGFWTAIVVPIAAVLGAMRFESMPGTGVVLLAVSAAWPLLPFCVLRRDVLERRDGSGWWRPRWPGFPALSALLVLLGAHVA